MSFKQDNTGVFLKPVVFKRSKSVALHEMNVKSGARVLKGAPRGLAYKAFTHCLLCKSPEVKNFSFLHRC
jgi:hypothetical protein